MPGICLWACLAQALPGQQSTFQGSVPEGTPTGQPIALRLNDAIARGLRNNLGLLVSSSASDAARGARLGALSALLPQVNGSISETVEQLNLKTVGFNFHPPGFSIPTIVGPFAYTDLRASTTISVYDYSRHKNYRAARESEQAAQLSVQDARNLVVQAVANAYLLVIADASRVDSLRAQVATDQALYDRTSDQQRAGTAAGIDVLRAQVQLKTQQQQLLAAENQLSKDKLALGRVIGLPLGQEFQIAESAPFAPLTSVTQDQALRTAFDQRADYQSAKAEVRAAEDSVRAARGERYPSIGVTANYGDVGPTIGQSHGTFAVMAGLNFNIFDGGRISADVIRAKAALKQRQDEMGDLVGRIDTEVRSAFLDIQSAADQVAVAQSNLNLANQTLEQARDRFAAGVSDNIEVVQAQGSVAIANDNIISALYLHNLAKVDLARAIGAAEQGIQRFLEVK